jgi:hypothetical protein
VAFILGDRAVKAARQSDLPKSVRKIIHDPPHYAEGTGERLEVKRSADLGAIRKLALSKLANWGFAPNPRGIPSVTQVVIPGEAVDLLFSSPAAPACPLR